MATTEFGKSVKIRLVEMEKTQDWLIEQIRKRTGLYCDTSYMSKIMRGVYLQPKIAAAIREILDLPDPANKS